MSRPGTIVSRASQNFCARPRSDGVAFIRLSMPRSIFKGYIYPADILTGCRQAVDEDYRTSIHLLASEEEKIVLLIISFDMYGCHISVQTLLLPC